MAHKVVGTAHEHLSPYKLHYTPITKYQKQMIDAKIKLWADWLVERRGGLFDHHIWNWRWICSLEKGFYGGRLIEV